METLTVSSTSSDVKIDKKEKMVTINGYFKVPLGLYAMITKSVQTGIKDPSKKANIMLLGPTGTGKTELISNIAESLNLPLTIFDMGTMADPIMGLVGSHVMKTSDGVASSNFEKSRFSQVIQQPGIVLLDELSRANPLSNNLLFPVLDFRRELSMEYSFHDNTPVKVHDECIFIATANIGSQYTGTHKVDRALLDRFLLFEVDSLQEKELKESMLYTYKHLNEEVVEKVVNTYLKINKMYDEMLLSFNMSIRHLKNVLNLIEQGFTIYDSFYAICKGLGGADGLKVIGTVLTDTKK